MNTMPIGSPFLGLNTRVPDTALHVNKVGDFLSIATNVDLNNKGQVRRRNATAKVITETGWHSLHLTGTTGYGVKDSVLYALDMASFAPVSVATLTQNTALSYVETGPDLYYSNGTDAGRITAGTVYPLGLPTPGIPTPTTIGGNLLPATYQVATAYVNTATGEESGISGSCNHVLSALGGIRITLPTTTPGATHINIYLSAANGSIPMWLAQVPVGTTTYDCISLGQGRASNGRFEEPLPAGRLFLSNGKLCSIVGSRVYVGSPWLFGYYIPVNADGSAGYIDFPAPVSVAIENQAGTYIVASKTHWFPGGDLANVAAMITDVLPFGAVPGTEFTHPTEPLVGWFSTKGVVIGDMGGQVKPLTAEAVDVVAPVSGNSVVFESDGYRRVVSCGYCVNLENSACSTYTDWDFTSVSGNYGTKADGIYILNCPGLVDYVIGFGKQSFGTEALKHLPAVYLGVNSDEPMQLRVQAPNDVDYTYDARSASTDTEMQRIDPGKGLRANWFDLSLLGTTDFLLTSVSFAPTASTRRI